MFTVTAIIWAIVVGLVLGVLAKLILPGKQAIPLWLTILVGIVAAFLGTYVAGLFGVAHTSGPDWIRHILQLVFAVIGVGVVSGIYAKKA